MTVGNIIDETKAEDARKAKATEDAKRIAEIAARRAAFIAALPPTIVDGKRVNIDG